MKINILLENGFNESFFHQASVLSAYIAKGFQLLFTNFKELEFSLKSLVFLPEKKNKIK